MTDRTPLADLTSDALDQLYDRLARAEAAIETVAEVLADHNGDEWSSHPATIAVGAAITMKPVSGPAATQATEPSEDLSDYYAPDPPIGCLTITAAEPVDTAHRYCILCGGQSQPAHTCDPAGLRTVYRGLADHAERAGVRRDQLAAILREVLTAYDATGCLNPTQHARWHAVLEPAKEQH